MACSKLLGLQLVSGLPDQDFTSFPVNILARAHSSIGVPDLQVVVVPVGVDLIPGVHVEHRVQALGGAGVLFELLHLHSNGNEERASSRVEFISSPQQPWAKLTVLHQCTGVFSIISADCCSVDTPSTFTSLPFIIYLLKVPLA